MILFIYLFSFTEAVKFISVTKTQALCHDAGLPVRHVNILLKFSRAPTGIYLRIIFDLWFEVLHLDFCIERTDILSLNLPKMSAGQLHYTIVDRSRRIDSKRSSWRPSRGDVTRSLSKRTIAEGRSVGGADPSRLVVYRKSKNDNMSSLVSKQTPGEPQTTTSSRGATGPCRARIQWVVAAVPYIFLVCSCSSLPRSASNDIGIRWTVHPCGLSREDLSDLAFRWAGLLVRPGHIRK